MFIVKFSPDSTVKILSSERVIFTQDSPILGGGSILFADNQNSNLSVANDVDLRMGSGDFTIEWFQYQTDNNAFPRIFQIGNFPSASIGVSIEGGIFYLWVGGSANSIGSVTPFKNVWVHFAISRQGTSLKVFKNGSQIGSTLTNSTNFNNSADVLRIGNESSASAGASFGGLLTNFRWVKEDALYTSNFTTPSAPLAAIANTKLLLLAQNETDLVKDSSLSNKTVTNNSTTFDSSSPF